MDDEKIQIRCHQCKHPHDQDKTIKCKSKNCRESYGLVCLLKNYHPWKEELRQHLSGKWKCFRCRGICKCRDCKKLPSEKVDDDDKIRCHQCKHTHPQGITIKCKSKNCRESYGVVCLAKNYHPWEEELGLHLSGKWKCFRCRGICKCRDCKKLPSEKRKAFEDHENILPSTSDSCVEKKVEEEEEEEEEEANVKSDDPLVSLIVEESLQDHSSRVEAEAVREEQDRRVYDLQQKLREAENQVEYIRNASLKESSELRQEILKRQQIYSEEINQLGKMKEELKKKEEKLAVLNGSLEDVTKEYHRVLAENRKLSNQIQDLLGKIRVFVRIRPFLKDHDQRQTLIKFFGDNGELALKGCHQSFKFNKVFGPASTQEEVFVDTKQLIVSVLDGIDVCIFAYGQTGSGKTYTMMGPDKSSPEDWGVNYRALNELFHLSKKTTSGVEYQISAQMIEIYNDEVYDLLSSEEKKLSVSMFAPTNGLPVPETTTKTVTSTEDVLKLMNLGLTKRAVGATKLNERSSRSHSVLNVHVCGTDLHTKAVWRGNLNLIDLAGSERVGKSEAKGERFTETVCINQSLTALGDVMAALARKKKSEVVPYNHSKLTKVLQKSLEGRGKTMMFVHIRPEVDSFSETMSTLKFAEKVSSVRLGAAPSTKEGIRVQEINEQVTSPSWSSRHQIGKFHNGTRPHGKSVGLNGPKDIDSCSDFIDKQSETSDEFIDHPDFFEQSKLVTEDGGQENYDDIGLGVLSTYKSNVPCKLPRPPLKTASSLQNWHKLGTPSRPSVKGSSSAKKSSSASSSLKSGAWL